MKHVTVKTGQDEVRPRGTVTIRAYKAGTTELVYESIQHNLIMVGTSTGRDWFIKWLLSGYTAVNIGLGINYGAIGTNATAPATTDTQLGTESARTTVAYGINSANTEAQLQFFFADAVLSNTTYREFGTFIGGTASANSGSIFNHALFTTPYVKAAGTDTTVEVDITFS